MQPVPRELLDFEKRNSRGHQARTKRVPAVVVAERRTELRFLHGSLEPQPAIERRVISLRRDVFTPRTLFQARQATVRGAVDPYFARPGFSSHVQNAFARLPILPPRIPLLRAPHAGEDRELELKHLLRAGPPKDGNEAALLRASQVARDDRRLFRAVDPSAGERICNDESLLHRVPEDGGQQRMKAIDGRPFERGMLAVAARGAL